MLMKGIYVDIKTFVQNGMNEEGVARQAGVQHMSH